MKERPELSQESGAKKHKQIHFQHRKVGPNATEKSVNVTRHTDDKKLAKGRKGKVKVAKGHLDDEMDMGESGWVESDLGESDLGESGLGESDLGESDLGEPVLGEPVLGESVLGESGNETTSAGSSPSSRSLPPRTAPGRKVQSFTF